jgi:hypothetical protein
MAHTHKMVDGKRIDLTADEIARLDVRDAAWVAATPQRMLGEVRKQRDKLLKETDWTMGFDSSVTDKDAWVHYRQALRDITKQDPLNVIWPVAPNA